MKTSCHRSLPNPRSLRHVALAEICMALRHTIPENPAGFASRRLTSPQSRMKLGSTESSSWNIIIAVFAIILECFEHARVV